MYKNLRKMMISIFVWTGIQFVCITPAIVLIGITFDSSVYVGMADPLPTRITYFILALISLIPSVIFWVNFAKFLFVNKLNDLFMADADGFVPVSDLAKEMGKPEDKIIRKAERAIRKGYLINCNYSTNQKAFLLSDKTGTPTTMMQGAPENHPFIGVHCPGCAASLKIRESTQGTCPFCGRLITAPVYKDQ